MQQKNNNFVININISIHMQRKCNKHVKLFSVFATKLSYSKEFVIRINRIFFRIKIYFIEFIRVTSEYDATF